MAVEQQRRAHPRMIPSQSVFVDYPEYRPQVRDLSLSGAFIEDPRPMAPGRSVKVKLWLSYYEPVAIEAMVRRVEEGRGIGVEFLRMNKADYSRLRAFVGGSPSLRG